MYSYVDTAMAYTLLMQLINSKDINYKKMMVQFFTVLQPIYSND